ncbi:hypothetical protein EZS27_029416 [termite gut metagenome]|uniref:Resolvase/invertase-type recombinase catalytic domain-containing protein n=1 Tax=termite gut metagenome TaxID=433724 RepID=A0A5J4QFZ4_9ZZZZ
MAEIERNLISMRTKEALARRKQEGKLLGRRPGDSPQMKIVIKNEKSIIQQLNKKIPKDVIAKQLGVSRSTLYRFLKK